LASYSSTSTRARRPAGSATLAASLTRSPVAADAGVAAAVVVRPGVVAAEAATARVAVAADALVASSRWRAATTPVTAADERSTMASSSRGSRTSSLPGGRARRAPKADTEEAGRVGMTGKASVSGVPTVGNAPA
jgi:hypothetical protein